MVFTRVAEFGAVETKDGDCEDELQKAQGQVGDDEWQRLAAGDSGEWFLVEARKCHGEGVRSVYASRTEIIVEQKGNWSQLPLLYLTLPYVARAPSHYSSLHAKLKERSKTCTLNEVENYLTLGTCIEFLVP